MVLPKSDPRAQMLLQVLKSGDVEALERHLAEDPSLVQLELLDEKGCACTLLHYAVDWPGHFPNVARTISTLIAAGHHPTPVVKGHSTCAETPLHWAASSDDVEALDALLDGGADMEHPGAIFTNGTAMSDAVIFAQWNCARRLVERGARTTFTEAAALGLLDRVDAHFSSGEPIPPERVTAALWLACWGGQLASADYLLARGADLNWIGWDKLTPLDCAVRSKNQELVASLIARGARHAGDLRP